MCGVVVFVVLVFVFTCQFCCCKTKLHIRNAKSSTTSGQLDICSKMYPAQISDEKSSFS